MPDETNKKDPEAAVPATAQGKPKKETTKPDPKAHDAVFNLNEAIIRSVDAFQRVPFLSSDLVASARFFDAGLWSGSEKLREDIKTLRKDYAEQANALSKEKAGSQEQQRRIQQLESTLAQLSAKERLGFLLNRVHVDAQKRLLESEEFQNKFLGNPSCKAFVMSVDIRRSTELMLKARAPEEFASFMTTLCLRLTHIIVESFGVFDKFTGDGVLAFFPDFYSGGEAPYRVVAVADACHEAFQKHYYDSRRSFTSVLKDVGLGIGVDYGTVHLVQVADGLTVVGEPVVYACRLSGAPPHTTLLNQPAYEVISEKCGAFCFVDETELNIKHEGAMVAYQVRLNNRTHVPMKPEWL